MSQHIPVTNSAKPLNQHFIEDYINFHKDTEPPTIYHRWAAISGISAVLGRNCWVQHGHSKIYPNQYVMIVGESGARKDTAIKAIRKMLVDSGYKSIAADRTTKEKFLMDLEEGIDISKAKDEKFDVTKGLTRNPTMRALFGEELSTEPSECLINVGEFNAFLGHGNIEFIDLLTNLWDYDGIYSNRIKNGKSVRISNPTLNLLGGNTNIGISMSFPTEVIGQGFFSRLVMVHSDPSGRRITFPPIPDPDIYISLVTQLKEIREVMKGELKIENGGKKALDEIYQSWKDLDDSRFKSYSTRRFTHLLKGCICCAASERRPSIDSTIVTYANTILHYTESFMPRALGEFGKARNSDVSAKIIALLEKAEIPLDIIKDIWPQVRRDVDNRKVLAELLSNLAAAGKIQQVGSGILLKINPPKFDFPYCNVEMLKEYVENQAKAGLPL